MTDPRVDGWVDPDDVLDMDLSFGFEDSLTVAHDLPCQCGCGQLFQSDQGLERHLDRALEDSRVLADGGRARCPSCGEPMAGAAANDPSLGVAMPCGCTVPVGLLDDALARGSR